MSVQGRSSNFTFAQLNAIQNVEAWLKDEKVIFTAQDRIKLDRALVVLNKVQSQKPFIRAMNALELYENAEKGIKSEKQIEEVKYALAKITTERDVLLRECAELKITLSIYERRTFWARLFGLFRA